VETAGEHGGVFAAHHGAGYPEVSSSLTRTGGRRFLMLFLLACVPLLLVEGLFLFRSTTRSVGVQAEEQRVLSDTLVLITVLNRYKTEIGCYPDRLEEIVPAYWEEQDLAELQNYEYRRIGTERFVLRPCLTGQQEEDAGIVRALAVIPRSLGRESSLEVFLRSCRPAENYPSGGGAP
jgi:hypothetical protein